MFYTLNDFVLLQLRASVLFCDPLLFVSSVLFLWSFCFDGLLQSELVSTG